MLPIATGQSSTSTSHQTNRDPINETANRVNGEQLNTTTTTANHKSQFKEHSRLDASSNLTNSTQNLVTSNVVDDSIELSRQSTVSEQCSTNQHQANNLNNNNLTKQTTSNRSSRLDAVCDAFDESLLLNKSSESDSKATAKAAATVAKNNFQLVKELFDADAHLYMSVDEMAAMEQLIRDNPRTCKIQLDSRKEELGFNLITKKKPHIAHIVKKVNPNLKSARSGLLENDQLLMVNRVDCRNLTHLQVVRLLEERGDKLKLVVCQPNVYQWYLNQGYELKLDYEDDQENEAQNKLVDDLNERRKQQFNKLDQPKRYKSQPQLNQATATKYNERCVDDARPIQVDDRMLSYVDTDSNSYKDNQIKTNDQLNSRNSFKRSYRLKKQKPTVQQADDAVDESLSMSTSVSPFDEKYNELRDEIFSQSSRVPNQPKSNTLKSQSTKSLLDSYNYKSENIEFNEYMDSSSHQLEKSETTVLESNDEFQNKKVTRKSIERIHKNYDDQPMKNVLSRTASDGGGGAKATGGDKPTAATRTATGSTAITTQPATRTTYTPVYGKTTLLSNSLFDRPKTTTSIFDTKPSSIFDKPYSDKLTTTSKSSYVSPNYTSSKYNTSYNNQSYSSYKNESSSYSKSYSLSPTTKYGTTSSAFDNQQTSIKEPYIERHVIEPKEAQLVHIYDDQEPTKQVSETRPKVARQPSKEPQYETKPMKTVQANSPNDLPSPRLCTLRLPKDRIASFGFTIKTSRKTNAKIIVDIIRNSIAHRGMYIFFKIDQRSWF